MQSIPVCDTLYDMQHWVNVSRKECSYMNVTLPLMNFVYYKSVFKSLSSISSYTELFCNVYRAVRNGNK
ncbi:hypothetical protein EB796_024916 [Bugula neritina]|uniref:Uncharacterized protein n=1 Tax=Bugula neritina TaxID=10212 RepID=A0A7J7IS66_BUGNE|nr:hypothetical protein EB796_024916 [Bugula neritina]